MTQIISPVAHAVLLFFFDYYSYYEHAGLDKPESKRGVQVWRIQMQCKKEVIIELFLSELKYFWSNEIFKILMFLNEGNNWTKQVTRNVPGQV